MTRGTRCALAAVLCIAFLTTAEIAAAQSAEADAQPSSAHFQTTYVWQGKRPFNAAYSGPNSLSPLKERSYSFTATAAVGVRAWPGGELYFNPEAAQGIPFSGLTGLGGFTNGELARTSGPDLTVYRARAFLRQTWGLGGAAEQIEAAANQLAGRVDKRRLVLTVGNLAIGDIFDRNAYSHDPRVQFMNWGLVTHGAYDFAADARGYSWGATLEYLADGWAVRGGRFLQPIEPNGARLDTRVLRHYGDQIEIERAHDIAGQPGKLSVLAFHNRALMARFDDALALAKSDAATPNLDSVRSSERSKVGIGVNLEQALSAEVGVFARGMWADGKTETYAYAEIDRSLSAGALVHGSSWGRAHDTVGVAFARHGLSRSHRDFLAAGGLGFFIGDGRLNYRPETVRELFYSLQVRPDTAVTVDWQRLRNPAYNADRGPANVLSLRLHAEF